MKPDYDRAAIAAMETLVNNNITACPVLPLPILKKQKNVLALSFTEISDKIGMNRDNLISSFEDENKAALTSAQGNLYIVAYNQRLPFDMLKPPLARELAHVVLGHDCSLPEDVRMAEAYCFAHHFLCPRPFLSAFIESGIPITIDLLNNMTGCGYRCLRNMQKEPSTHVPAELNRKVKNMFADYIRNILDYARFLSFSDESMLANFGTFMDGYEE